MSDSQFINYNWMPTVANHVLDASEDFYKGAGVSRLHNKNSIDPLDIKEGDIIFIMESSKNLFYLKSAINLL